MKFRLTFVLFAFGAGYAAHARGIDLGLVLFLGTIAALVVEYIGARMGGAR